VVVQQQKDARYDGFAVLDERDDDRLQHGLEIIGGRHLPRNGAQPLEWRLGGRDGHLTRGAC